tara:strand:+ start:5092 stop:5481 length:390 start_codon:yes stop_codon:yes gene_type:complete
LVSSLFKKCRSTITIVTDMTNTTTSPRISAAAESRIDDATTDVRIGLSAADHSRVIEMAWEDRTPFEAIEQLYGLTEAAVIRLMRRSLKPKAFRNWRQRVSGRLTKHGARRDPLVSRGYCATQYKQRSK